MFVRAIAPRGKTMPQSIIGDPGDLDMASSNSASPARSLEVNDVGIEEEEEEDEEEEEEDDDDDDDEEEEEEEEVLVVKLEEVVPMAEAAATAAAAFSLLMP